MGNPLRICWQVKDDLSVILHTDFNFSGGEVDNFAQDLYEQHGIEGVMLADYHVVLVRGGVFSWEEIMPRVESLVAQHTGATKLVNVEPYPRPKKVVESPEPSRGLFGLTGGPG